MKLSLVGISHRHAPIEVRERVALDARESAALARELAAGGRECVCLSTCNRTELYAVGDGVEQRSLEALRKLGGDEVAALCYRLDDHAAALHLFRVAAGLDSLVPGEGEILGQVRGAYEAGAPGSLLTGCSTTRCTRGNVRVRRHDRGEPGVGLVRGGCARAAGVRGSEGKARADRRRRQGGRACSAEPLDARRGVGGRRQPLGGAR